MRINQNVLALQTQGTLTGTNTRLEKSVEKLSSGLRINRASDDAAGLAISEKLRRQVRGLSRAVLNAQDGISMIQTGEGALNESHSILQRMRELAIQSGNDTLTSNDRMEIQKEVTQLRDDLNRISRNTEFNTKKLLDGSQTALVSASTSSARGIVTGGTGGLGGDFSVSIALVKGGASQMVRSQIFTIKGIDPTQLADGSTQLQSIAQFYDPNGVFALDAPKALYLHGNNQDTAIQIDGQMTLDKLSAAIQSAINVSSGLDMGNSKVMTVGTAMSGVGGFGGYIQITSGAIGTDGAIGFMSDQSVLSALGLATVREAKNNQYHVNLTDGQGWNRSVLTEASRAVGLLDGIDVTFTSQAAQVAGTQGIVEGVNFAELGAEAFNIGVGTITLAISLSGRYTMEGIARSINSQNANGGANEISGMNATIVGGELRIEFTPTTATIDSTINISGVTNDVLGLLNGTYSGFVDGKKDVAYVEHGWSRYIATSVLAAGTNLTVSVSDGVSSAGIQLLVSTTLATLGTSNVRSASDLVRFVDVQNAAKVALAATTVRVTLDQVGTSFAFTATRVGRENQSGVQPVKSQVNLDLNVVAGTRQTLASMFGFDNANLIQSRGKGDTNFRMHVVDNSPQYQIGADQGQTMKVTFADMSAESLGVANLDLTNIPAANAALSQINNAIDKVSSERSKLGAFQNRLEYAINNLRSTTSNLTAAESRIRDADIATEMIEFTRNQIMAESGNAMLAQTNTVAQQVLTLLR